MLMGGRPAVQPVVLLVLDGWGYSENTSYNAIHAANTPVWDALWESEGVHTLLRASGTDVGLPDQQMGNSEVGHMHIGGGRLVPQELTRITATIEDGSFFENPVLTKSFDALAVSRRALHILGLLSPGGVHSHEDHILATVECAARRGVQEVYLHMFLDGRDTPPKSAAESIQKVIIRCRELGVGRIATVCGRFYAMDRNKSWDRTQQAFDLILDGKGVFEAPDPLIALDQAYARGETDEFVQPTVVNYRGQIARVEDGDLVLFANFRADRARQLTKAFVGKNFRGFTRERLPALADFITMTNYGATFHQPAVFNPGRLHNTFGEVVAHAGLRQLRIAETEKYAHVTFFFNGGEERVFNGEDRVLVPSPHVRTYDEQPEMSADALTDRLVEAIESGTYHAIICNYANADMVGHTGNYEATVACVEALDRCLGRVIAACRKTGTEALITADHGNAERMRTESTKASRGEPHTAHTNNLVPLVYVGHHRHAALQPDGSLVDLAPTLLDMMGLPRPPEMTGHSLLAVEGELDPGRTPSKLIAD